jgi:hypothetical protein
VPVVRVLLFQVALVEVQTGGISSALVGLESSGFEISLKMWVHGIKCVYSEMAGFEKGEGKRLNSKAKR